MPCLKWAASATSITVIEEPGEPMTRTLPSPSVSRSSGEASISSAATSSRTCLASSAARMIALPARWVARDAKVPMQCGPVSVSPVSTRTVSNGTPSASAPIWASTVFRPWPRSTLESVMTKLPTVVAWTRACVGSPPRFMPVG